MNSSNLLSIIVRDHRTSTVETSNKMWIDALEKAGYTTVCEMVGRKTFLVPTAHIIRIEKFLQVPDGAQETFVSLSAPSD